MGDIVIEETNYKLFIMTMVNGILLVASIAIAIYGVIYKHPIILHCGLLVLIILLIQFIRNLNRVSTPRPILIISRDGFTDSSSAIPLYIPFSEIKQFETINIYGTPMIGVIPKNAENFLRRLTPVRQKVARERLKIQLPPFALSLTRVKDMSLEDVYSLLDKRLADYSRLYD